MASPSNFENFVFLPPLHQPPSALSACCPWKALGCMLWPDQNRHSILSIPSLRFKWERNMRNGSFTKEMFLLEIQNFLPSAKTAASCSCPCKSAAAWSLQHLCVQLPEAKNRYGDILLLDSLHFFQPFMHLRCTSLYQVLSYSPRKTAKEPQIRAVCSFGSIEAPARGGIMVWNRASVLRSWWNKMSSRHRQVETPAHRDALQSTYITKRFASQRTPISMDRIKEPNRTISNNNT